MGAVRPAAPPGLGFGAPTISIARLRARLRVAGRLGRGCGRVCEEAGWVRPGRGQRRQEGKRRSCGRGRLGPWWGWWRREGQAEEPRAREGLRQDPSMPVAGAAAEEG